MACEEYREELSAWVDGELSPEERARLAAHVDTCGACREALREFEETSHLVRSLDIAIAPARITDAAMHLVRGEARNPGAPWKLRIRQVLFEPFWPKVGFEAMGLAAAVILAVFIGREALLGGPEHAAVPRGAIASRSASPAQRTAAEPGPSPPAHNPQKQPSLKAQAPSIPPSPGAAVGAVPATPPPPSATAGEGGPIALPSTVEFAASARLSVTQPTPVFLAPNEYAPQAFTVNQSTVVEVIAKSRDGAWAVVATADGAPAYIPMSSLGSPQAASSPPPPPGMPATAEQGSPVDLPSTVEFDAASAQLSVTQPTPVFLAPNQYAPQAFTVNPGTVVAVIAKSRDGAWAVVATADGAPAYIPMSDLKPPA
jgi:anti-sigma factor RsiW